MIVECENCNTCFQLDEERIPLSGIRVRCSRCKQAFFLKHPEASEIEVVDAIAAEALEEAAVAAPEIVTDLVGNSSDDAPAAAVPADAEVAGDLGEPEDWDLPGDDFSLPEAEATDVLSARMRSDVAPKVADSQAALAGSSEPIRCSVPVVRQVGRAIGWLVFVVLFVATLVQGATRSSEATRGNTRYELGALRADSVATHWTRVGGGETLLVVTGVLHNPTSSPLALGTSVVVELLDESGGLLAHPPVLAGRPFGENALRTFDPASRAAQQASAAAALSRERIAAGGAVPFAAYFGVVPPDARRIRIGRAQAGPARGTQRR